MFEPFAPAELMRQREVELIKGVHAFEHAGSHPVRGIGQLAFGQDGEQFADRQPEPRLDGARQIVPIADRDIGRQGRHGGIHSHDNPFPARIGRCPDPKIARDTGTAGRVFRSRSAHAEPSVGWSRSQRGGCGAGK